jgi:hypothetical protein
MRSSIRVDETIAMYASRIVSTTRDFSVVAKGCGLGLIYQKPYSHGII